MNFKKGLSIGIVLAVLILSPSCPARADKVLITVGDVHLSVKIADTPKERANGLMHYRHLPDNQGMLFVFENEHRPSFWMKNTSIPLSIAFIASDGTIRQIEELEPLSLLLVKSRRNVLYALEVNQGWFKYRGITVGDSVHLPL